ncbi:MAG: succinyl-diaminopimelate desuccinylase [Pseudomonadota bacterium]
MPAIDPVALTADLVRCPSVTPEEGGAIALLDRVLAGAGFRTMRADRGGIANLIAVAGDPGSGPVFGFNGHTDVVPVGDVAAWSHDPFGAEIEDGVLYGRGATDMKSAVAAFTAAATFAVERGLPRGALILTVTGDEEGEGVDGTRAILDALAAEGLQMDACLVGEPTSREVLGDTVKIGRRGSMTTYLTARGVQGHTAYPHLARNPLPALVHLLDRLAGHGIDGGSEHFDPTTLALTTVDVGNPANNVIPADGRATLNIRFSDQQSSASLTRWIEAEMTAVGAETGIAFDLRTKVSGESFLTPPGALSDLVAAAVEAETGVRPILSTGGGTSDARFVRGHCPVVEFGLVGKTMHQVDECVEVAQIRALTEVYGRILRDYFA